MIEAERQTFVAVSGGADSTAMVLAMHEKGEAFRLLFTPTGNELPGVREHLDRLVAHTGAPLDIPPGPSLLGLMETFNALPNFRQRWCTRMVKIQPCMAFLKARPGSVLCVGLRADEPQREGMYGDHATYRYPLRELGWNRADVETFNASRGFSPPRGRTVPCATPSNWGNGTLYGGTTQTSSRKP